MFGLGMPELLLILVVVLVIFGPGKLPQVGQALGTSIRGFKKASRGEDDFSKNALSGMEEESSKKP